MLSIRQIVHTHRPLPNGECYGCLPLTKWSPDHVLGLLEVHGFDTRCTN